MQFLVMVKATPESESGAPPSKEMLVLNDNIARLKLDVQQIAPIHGRLVNVTEFRRALGGNSTK